MILTEMVLDYCQFVVHCGQKTLRKFDLGCRGQRVGGRKNEGETMFAFRPKKLNRELSLTRLSP